MAEDLAKEAKKQGKTAKIHIKIDTGMSRLGFSDTIESLNEIKKICTLDGINIDGLFSHFARADETDKSSVKQQIKRFDEFYKLINEEGIHIPTRHMC